MLYTQENVRANIRNRDGKRVFYLDQADTLTPSARDYLRAEGIAILPAQQARPAEYVTENGAVFREKPEHYTHLRSNILVPKTHPVIAFRGAMDTLQAQLLLAQAAAPRAMQSKIGQILSFARNILRWEVLQEPVQMGTLLGLTSEELRAHSHYPQKYYGIPHFMPECSDGESILRLNLARCAARNAELAAAHAFGSERADLLQALNRMSSAIYILMIQQKAALSPLPGSS